MIRLAGYVVCCVVVGLLGACGSGSSGESAPSAKCGDYPDAPPGEGQVLYVSTNCVFGTTDGSVDGPFHSISEALAIAETDATILVEAGTYEEALMITTDGLRLIGASEGAEVAGSEVPIVRPPAGTTSGLLVEGAHGVLIRGIEVQEAETTGVRIGGCPSGASCAIDLQDVRVRDTSADGSGQYGFGVLIGSAYDVTMEGGVVEGSESLGVLMSPDMAGSLAMTGVRVEDNKGGGVRLEFVPSAVIEGNTIAGNGVDYSVDWNAGVTVVSSQGVQILGNEIDGSRGWGLGVICLDVSDSEIGMNTIVNNAQGGVWIEGIEGSDVAGLDVYENVISENTIFGIILARGASAIIRENVIENTVLKEFIDPASMGVGTVGDGLMIYSGSWAVVTDNTVRANERIGILVDNPKGASTTITDNMYEANGDGSDEARLVLQHLGDGTPTTTEGVATFLSDEEAVHVLLEGQQSGDP